MSMQVQKTTTAGKKRAATTRPENGPVAESQQDVDVARMAQAEASAHAAERQKMIADAAYFRAEKRGFEPGHELEDWLAAEADVTDLQLLFLIAPVAPQESGSLS